MKRILFVGDLRPHTRTAQRLRALLRLGHDVHGVSTVSLDMAPPSGQAASFVSRLRHKLGRPRDGANANAHVVDALRNETFDVLWIEKAQVLQVNTLTRAAQLQPAMLRAFFSEDDMTLASNQSTWFRRSLPLYDVVFTTKSHNAAPDELPALGAKNVEVIAKTFDPELHRPLPVGDDERETLGAAIGFIGTFEEQRARTLLTLARSGLVVRVWGNGWDEWLDRHARLLIENRPVYGEDYVRSLCATDVNLGFLRKASRDQHTDRSVEIPACGAFLLAERTPEHLELFEEGREAEYFDDLIELTAKVHHYLAHPEERQAIAAAGRERCLREDYSHDAALARMLERLEQARSRRQAG